MAVRKEIREFDLLEYARCPMRHPELVMYSKSSAIQAAEHAVLRVLLDMFHTNQKDYAPDHLTVRALLQDCWSQVEPYGGTMPEIGMAAKRIRDLACRVRVVQPVTHYEQKIGAATITGEYAVVVDAGAKSFQDVMILRLRSLADKFVDEPAPPPIKHISPEFPVLRGKRTDIVNWSRWLHCLVHAPELNSIGVVNFGLDYEAYWTEAITIGAERVRWALNGVAHVAVTGNAYPSPGNYCHTCHGRYCEAKAM